MFCLPNDFWEGSREFDIKRFIYASSSSLYGNQDEWPCTELAVPRPFSPYGVTKLAAEHLVSLIMPKTLDFTPHR